MIILAIEHKKMSNIEKVIILNSKIALEKSQFYKICNDVKYEFNTFLNKVNIRINTLEIGEIAFDERKKPNFMIVLKIILKIIMK